LAAGAVFSGRVKGGRTGVSLLRLGRGAQVTLLEVNGDLEIRLSGNATADLTVAGPVRAEDAIGNSSEALFDLPEIVTLKPRPGAVPLRLILAAPPANAAVSFDGIYVEQLALTQDRPTDNPDAPFRTDVKSGKLRLIDIARDRDLRAGEPMRLDNLDAYLNAIAIANSSIKVELAGHAGRIVFGPPGFTDDITPTVLQHLVSQETLKLLWGTGAILLAGLWSTRKWARSVLSGD
jgi:hypothetical protein